MKTLLSRRRLLPRPIERVVSIWWFIGFLLVASLVCWRFGSRAGCIVFASFAAIILIGMVVATFHTRRLRHIAATRADDSICTFARAFDCRSTDTAIVRAVYEELQHYFDHVTPAFPFRPSDRFEEDLKLDPEDLDDIARTISHRTRRNLDTTQTNPFYSRVQTVHDLVSFFAHQPTAGNA